MGTDDVKRWVMSEIIKSRYDMPYVRADDHVATIAARDQTIVTLENTIAEQQMKLETLRELNAALHTEFVEARKEIAELKRAQVTHHLRMSAIQMSNETRNTPDSGVRTQLAYAEVDEWSLRCRSLEEKLATARAVNAKLREQRNDALESLAAHRCEYPRNARGDAEYLVRIGDAEIAAIEAGGKVEK